jgi:hypothetical protein
MSKSRKSLIEQLEERRSRRLLNEAITQAGSVTMRDELRAVARRARSTTA